MKSRKASADRALDGKHAGLQFERQIAPEQRDGPAEQIEDEDPEQHGAFMVSPDAAQFVEQRLRRMRILGDIARPRNRR